MSIASPVEVQACITLIAHYDGHYRRFTGLCTFVLSAPFVNFNRTSGHKRGAKSP